MKTYHNTVWWQNEILTTKQCQSCFCFCLSLDILKCLSCYEKKLHWGKLQKINKKEICIVMTSKIESSWKGQ